MGFMCTVCGVPTTMLFREYSKTVLKLHVCESCVNPVDKYVEFDATVIFMDIVLQKVEAFRHILYNSGFKAFWKLGIISIIVKAYIQWSQCSHRTSSPSSKVLQDFNIDLDWTFYFISLQSAFEFGIYVLAVATASLTYDRFRSRRGEKIENLSALNNTKKLLDGLLLANFGQILALPTIIWNETTHQFYLWLTFGFVVASNVQAYRAVRCRGKLHSWIVVLFGFFIRSSVSAMWQ